MKPEYPKSQPREWVCLYHNMHIDPSQCHICKANTKKQCPYLKTK